MWIEPSSLPAKMNPKPSRNDLGMCQRLYRRLKAANVLVPGNFWQQCLKHLPYVYDVMPRPVNAPLRGLGVALISSQPAWPIRLPKPGDGTTPVNPANVGKWLELLCKYGILKTPQCQTVTGPTTTPPANGTTNGNGTPVVPPSTGTPWYKNPLVILGGVGAIIAVIVMTQTKGR